MGNGIRELKVIVLGDAVGVQKAFADTAVAGEASGARVGKAIALAGATVAAAGIGVGIALYKVGENFDEAYDKIRIATGATGQEMAGLQSVFRSALKDVPTDLGKASDAVSQLAQRVGTTNPDLKAMSEQVLELSRITKTDLTGNIKSTQDAMQNWGVQSKDQVGKLDELFRASQKSGATVGALADTIAHAGPVMRQLGFSFEETAAMAATLSKAGVDSDVVFAGLKKSLATMAKAGEEPQQTFKRLTADIKDTKDPIHATQEAMSLFGAKAGPQMAALIREGKLGIDDMMKSIAGGKDTIRGAGQDTQDFAEKWELFKNRVLLVIEPIAARVFGAIGHAMDAIGPVIDKLQRGFHALAEAFGGNGTTEKSNTFIGVMERIGVALLKVKGWIAELVDFIVAHKDEAFGALAAVGVVLVAMFLDWAVSAAAAAAATVLAALPVIALTVLILAIGAALVYAWEHCKTFRDVVLAVVDWLRNVAAPAIEHFASYVVDQFDHLVAWVKQYWPEIKQVVQEVVDALVAIFKAFFEVGKFLWQVFGDSILNILKAAWQFIQETVKNGIDFVRNLIQLGLDLLTGKWGKAWDDVKGLVSAAWREVGSIVKLGIDTIVNVVTGLGRLVDSAASGVFDGIKAAFKAVINWVIDGWNGLHFTLPKVDFGPVHEGGQTIGVPKIPRLATGGDVLRSGFAVVGEEGAEVVSLPTGARVHPHGTGPTGGTHVENHYDLTIIAGHLIDNPRALGKKLIDAIKQYEQHNTADWRATT